MPDENITKATVLIAADPNVVQELLAPELSAEPSELLKLGLIT